MANDFQAEQGVITDNYQIGHTDHNFFALRGNSKDYDITLPAIADVADCHTIKIQHQNAGDFTQRIAVPTKDRKGNTCTDVIDNNSSPWTLNHVGMTVELRADATAKKWWLGIAYYPGNVL